MTRTLRNGTMTVYVPDPLNRARSVEHRHGGMAALGRFDYNYDKVGRIDWIKRDSYRGDRYEYYLDDQLKTAAYDAYNPPNNAFGATNITSLAYDENGNRTSQSNTTSASYTYGVNLLNEYNSVNGSVPAYDLKGNLHLYDGSRYEYDAQNRITDAVTASNTLYFYYDGLGRQIVRYVNGQWIYSVWDGWNLIEEYSVSNSLIHGYLHGAGSDEMVQRWDTNRTNTIWYYQDAQGSTSHLTNDAGTIIESYKYPPADSGAPSIYDASKQLIGSSNVDNRFLYTGRDWLKEVGWHDYRNRFYHPGLGRFLQSDPTGFAAGDSNLYRYCGGDPVNWSDPSGLDQHSFVVGAGLGVMVTWGTNNGQSNFGIYLGVGIGLSYSYTPSTSDFVFPGVVPAVAAQYTEGIGKIASVNVSSVSSTRDGVATFTTGVGYKNLQGQFGVTIDNNGNRSSAPPTISYMNGIFAGIGATSYGMPKIPAPGGTTFVDPNGCSAPDCVTTERVTVTATYLDATPYLGFGKTYWSSNGRPFHLGTTGNIYSGAALGVIGIGQYFPSLTSSGGGDWQTAGYFPGGGQPGEGSHPVGLELE